MLALPDPQLRTGIRRGFREQWGQVKIHGYLLRLQCIPEIRALLFIDLFLLQESQLTHGFQEILDGLDVQIQPRSSFGGRDTCIGSQQPEKIFGVVFRDIRTQYGGLLEIHALIGYWI